MIKINALMEQPYCEVITKKLDAREQLGKALVALASSKLIYSKGCLFLAPLIRDAARVSPDQFPDRTGCECLLNHVHIKDYLGANIPADQITLLGLGLAYVEILRRNIRASQIKEGVNIIVSSDEDNCIVRFHLIREGEEWLSPDLDG